VFLSGAQKLLPKDEPVAYVLLAEMIPSLAFQIVAPMLHVEKIPYWARIIFLTVTAFIPFFIVAYVESTVLKLLGIAISSISCGFGEITYFSLSSFYHKNTVSMYSSGTGGAGIAGSILFLALNVWVGLTPKITLLILSPLTLFMAVCYFLILEPFKRPQELVEKETFHKGDDGHHHVARYLTLKDKLYLQIRLFRYTGPLFVVYFAEYFINTAVAPALQFPKDKLFPLESQYIYYSFLYQAGVFISRSSANFIQIKLLWLMAGWQCVNAILLFCAAHYQFLPTIWIVFLVMTYEGLLGGAVFVNAFYLAAEEIEDDIKEFCMSSISMWYGIGILLSGLVSIPVGDWLLPKKPPTPPPQPQPQPQASPTPLFNLNGTL